MNTEERRRINMICEVNTNRIIIIHCMHESNQ